MLMPTEDDNEIDSFYNEKWPENINLLDLSYDGADINEELKLCCDEANDSEYLHNERICDDKDSSSNHNNTDDYLEYNLPNNDATSDQSSLQLSWPEDHSTENKSRIKEECSMVSQSHGVSLPRLIPGVSKSLPKFEQPINVFPGVVPLMEAASVQYSSIEMRKFICEVCEKVFGSKKGLKQHQLIHYGVKNFVCEKCDKRFLRKKDWQCHEKTHQPWIPRKRSLILPTSIKNKASLSLNIQLDSRNIPSLLCNPIKPLNGHFESSLNNPRSSTSRPFMKQAIHSAGVSKQFQCGFCFKEFSAKRYLSQHQRYHCPKLFNKKRPVNQSHSLPNDFQCSLCFKSFNNKASLDKHLLAHSTQASYPCSLCDKKFDIEDELKRHYQMHSGELKLSLK